MSCWIALTLQRHVILVADSMRRVLGRRGDAPLTEPIRLEDARKLHRISEFLWVTGIGLGGFHEEAAHVVMDLVRMESGFQKASLADLEKVHVLGPAIRAAYASRLREALVLARELGGSPIDPEQILTDLLLGAMTREETPVLLRFDPREDTMPELLAGPGRWLISPDCANFCLDTGQEIQSALDGVMECLMSCEMDQIKSRAWDLLPPVMAMVARARPREVSPSGNLVIIGTHHASYQLF